ncbi:hypothetical protein [Pantoea ananatis]|uniref:hypothetical protein n=1 Tax=Pantoea ananas TaxID=553 RepID=UPI002350D50E|nr:hypothetical protein [Pantoea ananatis]
MGFPSLTQDYAEIRIDLNKLLVSHPHATFFIKADAHYPEQGVLKGAMLVVVSPEDEM